MPILYSSVPEHTVDAEILTRTLSIMPGKGAQDSLQIGHAA
jgi:hypothetical protein